MSMIRRLSMGLAMSIGLTLLATPAQALTLQDLLNGSSITVGDKTFSNFSNFSQSNSGTAPAVSAGDISVTGINSSSLGPGLQFQTSDWSISGVGTQDTKFSYTVTVNDPTMRLHDVSMGMFQGTVGNGTGSNITVTEGVSANGSSILPGNGLFVGQANTGSGNFSQMLFAGPVFTAPQTSVSVTKDIGLNNTDSGTTAFSVLTQNFSQISTAVPEPSTLAVAGLGALGFIGYGLRRRLKK